MFLGAGLRGGNGGGTGEVGEFSSEGDCSCSGEFKKWPGSGGGGPIGGGIDD